jgi:hypothetical protein
VRVVVPDESADRATILASAWTVNSPDPLGARGRFLAAIENTADWDDGPARLCGACVTALLVPRVGIAVHVDDIGLEFLCASDEVAERAEWAQVTLGEGPCVDAVASCGPVAVPNLTAVGQRWPMFAAAAAELGLGAIYSLPLQMGAIKVGVLDLYHDTPAALDAHDYADAVGVADLVTAILLTVGRTGQITEALGPWWDQPLSTREVHQATGMIMVQLGVDARDAYVRLQVFAYGNRRLLNDVAHDVVDRRFRFAPEPDNDRDPDPLTPTC